MKWLGKNWLKIVAILFLLGSLFPIPYYAYFQLMSWIVMGAALIGVWQARAEQSPFWMWLLAFVAVIFNPIAPFYFRQDVWQGADIIASLILFISLWFVGRKK